MSRSDHLVVAVDLLERPLQDFSRVLAIARKEFLVGPHDTVRRTNEALPIRIVARPADQGAHCFFRRGARRIFRNLGSFELSSFQNHVHRPPPTGPATLLKRRAVITAMDSSHRRRGY